MQASEAAPTADDPRALVLRGLTKEYRKGFPVLSGIDLVLPGSGLTAIIGPSGTGKSTLIRCINRLVQPTSGEILFRGQDLARLSGQSLRNARRRIGMVFQEYNLVERLTVMENLLCGRLGYVPAWRAWLRKFPPEDIARAFDLLDAVGLPGFATRRADALVGRTAPARRHRAGHHAGTGNHSGRRADVLARSQDLRGDHGDPAASSRASAAFPSSSTSTMSSWRGALHRAWSACPAGRWSMTGRRRRSPMQI